MNDSDIMDNSPTWEAWKSHWDNFADAFAHPIKTNGLLRKFVTNPDVTGAYAEAWIRSMAKSMLPQFKISTGAIIRPTDKTRNLKSIPQCDMIIWIPSILPAIFEQGDFALVPYSSVRAIIEIKRTCNNLNHLNEQLLAQQKCIPHEFRSQILGLIVSHPKPLFEGNVTADWLTKKKQKNETPLTRLLNNPSCYLGMKIDKNP